MLTVVHDENEAHQHSPAGVGGSMLDELAREGARRMLAAALQAEVAAYIEAHADQLDDQGRRLVVRNGSHAARQVATVAGAVPVKAPRVNDKRIDEATGQRRRFASAILPAWTRKSPQVAEVLPLLYLHGLSSGDFVAALEQFCGSTSGLSAAIRLKQEAAKQDQEISVCVIEKGSEVGAHILSGAVIEPRSLNELIPDWKERGAPLHTPAPALLRHPLHPEHVIEQRPGYRQRPRQKQPDQRRIRAPPVPQHVQRHRQEQQQMDRRPPGQPGRAPEPIDPCSTAHAC